MPPSALSIFPVKAPVQKDAFDLIHTVIDALNTTELSLQNGDVLAVSSKYAAISEGRITSLSNVKVTDEAANIAERYNMLPEMAQLVINEADYIFGGIGMGFLLTAKDGIISPNAGLDRSNIPSGKVVLFPEDPYATAQFIQQEIEKRIGVHVGVILTDSWLMPGRLGTAGVALSTAGFHPMQDERGKQDLFGNPMTVTVRGLADSISVAAQLVMGERDEATPFAVVRGADIQLTREPITLEDVAIDWRQCIYVESLTLGLLSEDVHTEIANAAPYKPKRPAGAMD